MGSPTYAVVADSVKLATGTLFNTVIFLVAVSVSPRLSVTVRDME